MMRLFRDQKGVTALEYGLIAALIAVAIMGAVSTIGTSLNTTFTNVGNCLTNVANCTTTGGTQG